jgi:hypothetical protein
MAKKPPPRLIPPLPKRPKRKNEFGDPADTLYAGGTPLFDETGGGTKPPKRPAPKKPRGR